MPRFPELIQESSPFIRRFGQFRRKDRVIPLLEKVEKELLAFKADPRVQSQNPALQRLLSGFAPVQTLISEASANARNLPDLLRRSATASTVPTQIASLQTARQVAGRGGLAFGGGGAAIAARAAGQVSPMQTAAQMAALAQAPLAQAQAAATLSGALQPLGVAGQLYERQVARQLNPQEKMIAIMSGLANLFEQTATQRAVARLGQPSMLTQIGNFLRGAGSLAAGVTGAGGG